MTARRQADPDTLAAIARNRDEADRAESQYAREEFALGRSIAYCHGPGWPVIALQTIEQWEQRAALSRRRN